MLGADLAIASWVEEGVRKVFGVPGTTEVPLLRAAQEVSDVEYYLCLHEAVAIGMADGFTRASTSALALANIHATQGTLNGLGFIRAALRDRVPLLTFAGMPAEDMPSTSPIISCMD